MLRRRPDQTPLEFASSIDAPEASSITQSYNRALRFGAHPLSASESAQIERFLHDVWKLLTRSLKKRIVVLKAAEGA
ncbi:MAG: DUF4129 domain-containing protein [Pyrinomonadaceae bacterium]